MRRTLPWSAALNFLREFELLTDTVSAVGEQVGPLRELSNGRFVLLTDP